MFPFNSVLRLTFVALLLSLTLPSLAIQQSTNIQNSAPSISDTIFRSAVNSPGYLVVKKSDWEAYKKLWNDSITSQVKRLESERVAVRRKLDSLNKASILPTQALNQQEPSDSSDSVESSDSSAQLNPVLLGILLLFLVANGLGLFFFFLRKNKGMKDQNERLNLLENELSDYKTASIQRERKLMRELIDTRQALEGEKAKQSSGNEEKG
jgi:hypothetical protein